jgi:hypothetical protein
VGGTRLWELHACERYTPLRAGILHHAPHSWGWDFGSQPSAFAVAPLEVLLRYLPPFPVYSLAGAVDGGKGGDEDVSGDCGNAGALRAGVEGLPGVLSTKVRVLLRPGGVEGHPGELGTTLVVSSLRPFPGSYFSLVNVLFCRFWACQRPCRGFTMGFNMLYPFRLLDLIR